MGASATQLAALLKEQDKNITERRYIADHMTASIGEDNAQPSNEDWLDYLGDAAEFFKKNTAVMLNAGTLEGVTGSRNSRILNSEGFISDIKINYTFAVPGAYIPWTSDVDREVKQIVFHSFGQNWHAYQSSGKWLGAMNKPGGSFAHVYQVDGQDKIAWVPRGTNVLDGMSNYQRLSATLQSIMSAPQGVTGVHFLIDRSGNLYVMADCNSIFNSSGSLSETCISIGLEEALYLDRGPEQEYIEATWLPSGDPPGTGGTLKYWDYSKLQYLTLAVLIQKLRQAYPPINTETHSTETFSVDSSFVGFTMHGHLKDASPITIDVSPHFQDEQTWTDFFKLVSNQIQVAQYNVWKDIDEGYKSRHSWVEKILNSVGTNASSLNQQATVNPSIAILTSMYRAHQEALRNSEDYRASAATKANNESVLQNSRKSVGKVLETSATTPTIVPSPNQDYTGKVYSVVESREVGIDSDDLY